MYKITTQDGLAKFICEDRGLDLDIWPVGNQGKFRIAIYKQNELVVIRKLEYNYEQKQYALYETYRALAKKIIDGERAKAI